MRASSFALAAVLVLGAGCSKPVPPPLYAVTGKVVHGQRPVGPGTIQFRGVDEGALTTLGQIDTEGNFTLSTLFDDRRHPGVAPGQYHAIVMLNAERGVTAIELAPIFHIEARDNHLTVDLAQPRRSR